MKQQEFLRLFGNPLVAALKDNKQVNSFDFSKHHMSDVLIKLNEDQPYWLFFTPNGNYGDIQEHGKSINRSQSKLWNWPAINALVVDVDIKESSIKDMDVLFEHIQKVCMDNQIPPSLINRSWWWYHIFWIIDPEHRQVVWDTYGKKVLEISKYLLTLFDWWDCQNISSSAINWFIRLPWSYHWKTGTKILVETVYESDSRLTFDHISSAMQSLEKLMAMKKKDNDFKIKIWYENYTQINNIKFPDLFQALEKVPRFYQWVQYIFKIENWTEICIITKEGEIIRTDWYRYCRNENYINCFSKTYHPIDERPMGWIYSFLFYYFERNEALVNRFLKDAFGVDLTNLDISKNEEIKRKFIKDDYTITVTNRRIVMTKTVDAGKKKIEVSKDIFKSNIEFIARTKTNVTQWFTENDEMSIAYIVEINWARQLMHRYPSRRKFNDKYCKQTFFYGEDDDLWLLYEALDSSDLPEVETLMLNGYHWDVAMLGGKIVYWDATWRFVTPLYEYDLCNEKEITVHEYLEKLQEIYDDHIAIPALLETLAGMGMNLWKDCSVFPSMVLTGRTWCGKSSLSEALGIFCWHHKNARKLSLPTTSPQPLKQAACDYSLLRLEELTSLVSEKTEESLRNIVNRDKWGRGYWTENVNYLFRSFLITTGERTLKDESLNNRMANIIMSKKNWKKDAKDKIDNIKKFTCMTHILKTYIEHQDEINEIRIKYANKLSKIIDSRLADVRSYLFVANDIFEINIDFDTLFGLIKYHLAGMWFWRENEPDSVAELRMFLCRLILQRRAQCVRETTSSGETTWFRFIFVDETVYEKLRWRFNMMIDEINNRWQRITLTKDWLDIMIKEIHQETVDHTLEKVTSFIYQANKKFIENVEF